jgi:PAS fold
MHISLLWYECGVVREILIRSPRSFALRGGMTSGRSEISVSEELAVAVLDALPDATAVLDSSGSIVAVNHTWRMFALDNGGHPEVTGVGVNYLDLCARSATAGCAYAGLAADGIRAVLAGDTVHSELEYPCPSPATDRWFLMRVNPLAGLATRAVVSPRQHQPTQGGRAGTGPSGRSRPAHRPGEPRPVHHPAHRRARADRQSSGAR